MTAVVLTLDFYARRFDRLLVVVMLAGVALLAASAFTGTGGALINGDAAESFEWARAAWADGRLPREHIRFPFGVAAIGSIAYGPALLLARGLVAAGAIDARPAIDTGWWLPLQAAYCLPILVLSFAGFRANAAMLRDLGFDATVARATTLFWIVTTNVGYYALKEPAMTESATYATLSVYYFLLVRWYYREPGPETTARAAIRRALAIGVALGVAGIVRQQNILHALSLPLVLMTRRATTRPVLTVGVAAAASAALFVLPWIAWYRADGHFALLSYNEGHFNWLSPQPLKILFVPGYHGLFLFHPAFLLAAVGLASFFRRHPALRAPWILAMLLQFYLLSTWYWLSLGASTGHRGFFTIFPLLLCGFAAFAEWARDRGRERALVGGMFVLAVANAAVSLLVLVHVLDPSGGGYPANSGFPSP